MSRLCETKRNKTKTLRIDSDEIISPDELAPDAKLEGYRDFVVQDIVMESRNTRYRRAVFALPMGLSLSAGDPLASIRTSVAR